ncbi:MAG: Type I restriction modification DNA specificity domain protein [Candidatus Methanolliviera sp. GoM_asphalt]|nr:MAG: Type I restriction modification DNA specificity domain protein [Candidatus Methanolliviera sp. GoM_asphalt]
MGAGDIVFTKIGANIGDSAILPRKYSKYNFSQNVAGAKIKSNEISPYYLAAYLSSKYGRIQLKRIQMLSGQGKLELVDIRKIPVVGASPELQDSVGQLYLLAEDKIKNSIKCYVQAENLLLEELGLKDFKPKYELSYTANLSKAFESHRIDAEYFQPCYDEVIKKIIEYQNDYTQLLNCVENVKPDFDPSKYPDKIFSYVELADIDSSIGIIYGSNEIKGEEAPSRARRILRKNDVIASSVEGSLEKVALVDEEYEGSLASTRFFQFRSIKIFPEVLLVLSKSMVLQTQLKKECTGTILTAVPNEALKRILIPIIPKETQQKIASLVQRSHEARRKAKELLEEAKRKVEEAIENERTMHHEK